MPLYQSPIESFFEQYLTCDGASKKTRKNYRADINQFIQWVNVRYPEKFTEPAQFHKITARDIQQYLKIAGLERKISTITRYTSSLRAFFTALIQADYIPQERLTELFTLIKEEEPTEIPDLRNWKNSRLDSQENHIQVQKDIQNVSDFFDWIKIQKNI